MAHLEGATGKVIGAFLLAFCFLVVVASGAGGATVQVVTSGDGAGVVKIEVADGPPSFSGYWGDCPSYCGPQEIDDALLQGLPTAMVFTAQPAEDSTFDGWSGSCTGTAPVCRVPLVGLVQTTAKFTRKAPVSREPSREPARGFLVGGQAHLSTAKSGRPNRPRPVTIDLILRTSGDPLGPIAKRACCTPRGGGLFLILPRALLRAATDEAHRPGSLCNLALARNPRKPCPTSTRIATGEVTTVRVLLEPRGARERWLIDFYALGPRPEEAAEYVGRRIFFTWRRANGAFVAAYESRANVERTLASLNAPLPEEVRSKILIVEGRLRLGGTSAGKSWVASTGCPPSGRHAIRWSVINGNATPGATPLQARCTP